MSKKTEKSLKSANQPKLMTFAVVNLVVSAIALAGYEKVFSLLRDGGKGDWALLARVVGLPAVGTLAVGLLGWLIPRNWKEVLVFWRLGPGRLPSSEAFTMVGPNDPRIDMKQLSARLGSLPTDSAQQNTVWYSAYRKHSKEAAVNDANSAYLLYRDMAALMPLVVVTAILLGIMIDARAGRVAELLLGIGFEFLLVIVAAINESRRLVANVLAIEAARVTGPANTSPSPVESPKPRTRKKKEAAS